MTLPCVGYVAELLRDGIRHNKMKILRIYSDELERQVFPIPRESPVRQSHGRRYELIGHEEQKSTALHFLIRAKTNPYSDRIKKFDKFFEKNKHHRHKVTDKDIEE